MIVKYDSFSELDIDKLRDVIESGFGRELVSGYFEKTDPKYVIVYSEGDRYYGAAIVIEKEEGMDYIDKLVVRSDFKRKGIGKKIWSEIEKEKIFWRASLYNSINFWYMKNSEGHIKKGNWYVFWIGLDTDEISKAVDYAIDKDETLESSNKFGLTWEEMEDVYTIKKSLPYVRKFSGSYFLLKIDEPVVDKKGRFRSIINDINILEQLSINPIVIVESCKSFSEFGNYLRNMGNGVVNHNLKPLNELMRSDGELLERNGKFKEFVEREGLNFLYASDFDDVDKSIVPRISGLIDARKVFYVTDIPGVTVDNNLISYFSMDRHKDIEEHSNMDGKDKLEACFNNLNKGVESAHILSGMVNGTLLLEIFSNKEVGTVVKEYFE